MFFSGFMKKCMENETNKMSLDNPEIVKNYNYEVGGSSNLNFEIEKRDDETDKEETGKLIYSQNPKESKLSGFFISGSEFDEKQEPLPAENFVVESNKNSTNSLSNQYKHNKYKRPKNIYQQKMENAPNISGSFNAAEIPGKPKLKAKKVKLIPNKNENIQSAKNIEDFPNDIINIAISKQIAVIVV